MSAQQHYFTPTPRVPSHPAPVHLRLPDLRLDLVTDRGVFAYGQVDRGTDLLLRTIPPPPPGDLLDLGCGYGAIAVALARRAPASRVWAVDVNQRALALTRRNADAAGADNVVITEPAAVPDDVRFAAVYSNPPVRVGKAALHDLLGAWMRRLDAGGVLYLVVQRNLGSDSLGRWLESRGCAVERVRSRAGYRVLAAQRSSGSGHD